MGRCAVGTTYAGTLFRADAHRAVVNGLLSLYLVALYLDAKLGRPGQSGVRADSAVCGNLRLDCAGAGVLPGGVAVKSSTGTVAERDVAVADGGYFVPTYNEDLNVVKNTIYASLGIDWPKDKLNIWILDDGGRESFRQFARHVGVHYIARATHEHAKAGNINNALKHAKGEFVAIFDCDHVPTRSFLQMTMGWFLKEKQLAMMQTPHHFFSRTRLSATWDVFVKRLTKARCFTDWYRTVTICGTPLSFADRAR